MQSIKAALFGEPDYQPIPPLTNKKNSNGQYNPHLDPYNQNDPESQPLAYTLNNSNENHDHPLIMGDEIEQRDRHRNEQLSESNTSCLQDCNLALTLTRTERFIGFIILFLLGWFLSISTLTNYQNLFIKPLSFSMWYSVGNILALFSNFFLYGPTRQIVLMFSKKHRIFTIFFIFTIAGTITTAWLQYDIRIVILFVILQFIASICYTLSFLLTGLFGKALWWLFGNRDDHTPLQD